MQAVLNMFDLSVKIALSSSFIWYATNRCLIQRTGGGVAPVLRRSGGPFKF
jgi:hypothetical protein